jgi:hypothetical protein
MRRRQGKPRRRQRRPETPGIHAEVVGKLRLIPTSFVSDDKPMADRLHTDEELSRSVGEATNVPI